MKAAIVTHQGQQPVYGDFGEPIAEGGEVLVTVSAAALNPLTRGRAAGTHYSSDGTIPFVVGVDGVGRLEDGRRIYFVLPRAPYGSMAERTVVQTDHCAAVPDNLDDLTAAAIANPGMSSWAAYKYVAHLMSGEAVLVNGATGQAGGLAVQIAKLFGARKVVATGRDIESLKTLLALGADEIIVLSEDADAQIERFRHCFADGIDVVVDYLWGPTAERLLNARVSAGSNSETLRYVQVGASSAPQIMLPASVLRSTAIQLMGSGLGSIPFEHLTIAIGELLMATAQGSLQIAVNDVPLAAVETAWSDNSSKLRTVFTIA